MSSNPHVHSLTVRALLLGAGGGVALVSPAALLAQAQTPAPVVRTVLESGAKVRLTVADTAGLPPGNAIGNQVVARFVAFDADSGGMIVRLQGNRTFTVPTSGVRRLDVRRGRGFCTANLPNRVVCLAAGAGAGYLLGYGVGYVMSALGKQQSGYPAGVQSDIDAQHRADVRNEEIVVGRIGAILGFAASFAFGRDRWVPVAAWPPRRP